MKLPEVDRDCIGIFDSGVGGLTVMKQLIKDLPHEDMIYFGDTARLPYGMKNLETIVRYSIENAIFLMEKRIKLLIVACNTASALAVSRLTQIFNIPIVGVITPAVTKALHLTKNHSVAILGTKSTIQSGVYQQSILKQMPMANIHSIACPLLVHIVEEKYIDHPISKMLVQDYLRPIKNSDVDTIILGCTHYPLLRSIFEEEIGGKINLVDSGAACAEMVVDLLRSHNLHTKKMSPGSYRFFVSDDPEKFRSLSTAFLGIDIQHLELAISGF